MNKNLNSKKLPSRLFLVGNIALIIGLGVFGGYYFRQYQHLKANPPSAEEVTKTEVERIVAEVGKLYALPEGEEPSIATVKDKDQLKDQPFFDKAENGDITLIYSEAKLAILFRPNTKQLVNVSTLNIESSQPVVKVIGPKSARTDVEKTIKDKFKDQLALVDGGSVQGANTGDDSDTGEGIIVVDLTGQRGGEAKKLAEELGGKTAELPEGEERPAGVDLLVVVTVSE